MKTIACHHCKTVWSFEPPLGRRDVCPKCSNDARVCKNCRFFDASAYRHCREEQAEWVKEKDRGNFCGYFDPLASQSPDKSVQNAKDRLNALFGDGGVPSDQNMSNPQVPDLSSELEAFLKKRQK